MADTNETQVEVTQAEINAALNARVPGGSDVWHWLPQLDAHTPALQAEIVIRSALEAFARHRIQAEKRNKALAVELRTTLNDALAGWRYIRANHGDLYGVGWDRVENRLNSALAALEGDE